MTSDKPNGFIGRIAWRAHEDPMFVSDTVTGRWRDQPTPADLRSAEQLLELLASYGMPRLQELAPGPLYGRSLFDAYRETGRYQLPSAVVARCAARDPLWMARP